MNNNHFLQVLIRFHISHNLDHVWVMLRLTGPYKHKNSHAGSGLQPDILGMLYFTDHSYIWWEGMVSYVVCQELSLVFFNKPKKWLKLFWLIHVCQLHYLLHYVMTTVSVRCQWIQNFNLYSLASKYWACFQNQYKMNKVANAFLLDPFPL